MQLTSWDQQVSGTCQPPVTMAHGHDVQRLKEMDINIVETTEGGKDFSAVASEDVVILPAFGASYQEMKLLNDRSVHIVDTTCPWVRRAADTGGPVQKCRGTRIVGCDAKSDSSDADAKLQL